MDEVTFTKVRSQLPAMDSGANEEGKRYVLKRHKKERLVVLSVKDFNDLVEKAGGSTNTTTADVTTIVINED